MRLRLLAAVLILAGCAPKPLPGTAYSAAGLHLVAPPGWTATLAAPNPTDTTAQLGWATNQAVGAPCEPPACRLPIGRVEPTGILVVIFRVSCLPNCGLPNGDRTLIGGREASSQDDATTCGSLSSDPGRAITISVTPQRHDILVVCEGADAPAAELDQLLASLSWTIP